MSTMTSTAPVPIPAQAKTLQRIARTAVLTTAATGCFMVTNMLLRNPEGVEWVNSPVTLAIHLGSVIPALCLGGWVLARPKGNAMHKLLGRIWMLLMITTAISSFWLRGMTGGLSFIHIFTFMPIISLPLAIYYARIGNIEAHKGTLMGTYIGMCIAGAFSLVPGRLLGHLVFGF